MGEYLQGGGDEVDGVSFGLWMPDITAQALKPRRYKITDKATGAPLAKLPLTVPIAATVAAYEAEGYEVEWSWTE